MVQFIRIALSCRADVLVNAEEIGGVIFALYLGEANVVLTVGGAYSVAFIIGEEIDVNAAAGEGGRGMEKFTRPTNAPFVVSCIKPATMDIHGVFGITVAVRHSVGRWPGCRTTIGAKENLALGRGLLLDVVNHGVEQAIIECSEIVGFPVVTRPRRKQRIKSLLPGCVRLHADMLTERSCEIEQGVDQCLARHCVTRIK